MDELDGANDGIAIPRREDTGGQELTNLPDNVGLGLIFRDHAIKDPKDIPHVEAELKGQFTQTFSPGSNNILLMEDAALEDDNGMRKLIQEGYERFHSYQQARYYAVIRSAGHQVPADIDLTEDIADLQRRIYKEGMGDPAVNYLWTVDKVLDDLNSEGYNITRVLETGIESPLGEEDVNGKMTFGEFRERLTQFTQQKVARDRETVEQITGMVETAEAQPVRTNIVALFGTNHQTFADNLPSRFKSVTRTFAAPIRQNQVTLVRLMLEKGMPVSDGQWLDAYYGRRPSARKMLQRFARGGKQKEGNQEQGEDKQGEGN